MDESIRRFQMGFEQLPPASAGIPHDGKELWQRAAVLIRNHAREVTAMSGTPFEAGISSEWGETTTSSECIASFKPKQGSDNPFKDSVPRLALHCVVCSHHCLSNCFVLCPCSITPAHILVALADAFIHVQL